MTTTTAIPLADGLYTVREVRYTINDDLVNIAQWPMHFNQAGNFFSTANGAQLPTDFSGTASRASTGKVQLKLRWTVTDTYGTSYTGTYFTDQTDNLPLRMGSGSTVVDVQIIKNTGTSYRFNIMAGYDLPDTTVAYYMTFVNQLGRVAPIRSGRIHVQPWPRDNRVPDRHQRLRGSD